MLVLASNSSSRKKLLSQASIKYRAVPHSFDEEFYKAEYRKAVTEGVVAERLAQGKALSTSKVCGELVLGSDQSKSLSGLPIDKPKNRQDAFEQCLALKGKTHCLHSSACLALNGEIVWTFSQDNFLTMHDLSEADIQSYLNQLDENVLFSSGIYQIEGMGIGLFSKIEGDFFSIVGLPLVPLMNKLKQLNENNSYYG